MKNSSILSQTVVYTTTKPVTIKKKKKNGGTLFFAGQSIETIYFKIGEGSSKR